MQELLIWMHGFAKGILELQELGIFHEDLGRQNILKFRNENGKFSYKIIDFDWALNVTPEHSKVAYSLTKQLIQYLINFKGRD